MGHVGSIVRTFSRVHTVSLDRTRWCAFTVWAGAMAQAMGSAYAQDAQALANPSAAVAALAPAPIENEPRTEAQATDSGVRRTYQAIHAHCFGC